MRLIWHKYVLKVAVTILYPEGGSFRSKNTIGLPLSVIPAVWI